MKEKPLVIVIIPARGDSKGIPKKNIRLMLGKSLISYTIKKAFLSKYVNEVVVSTDDEEIAHIAEQYGAQVLIRPKKLATDKIPLDPVIHHAVCTLEKKNKLFDIIITLQPTSPLLRHKSIDICIEKFIHHKTIDTVISVVKDPHLAWIKSNNKFHPLYKERVNRQFLPEQYRETGGIIACRRSVLDKGTRIGQHIDLLVLDHIEGIDIDSDRDWWIAEKFLKRKKIMFRVDGNNKIGLGHIYRTLTIANRVIDHEIIFVTKKKYALGRKLIEQSNYPVITFSNQRSLFQLIDHISPDIIINDILDASKAYMELLVKRKIFLVNFEDLGEGAHLANIVFNALYKEDVPQANHYWGKDYYCLREEFYAVKPKIVTGTAKNILITFGGCDINNYTFRILKILNSLQIDLNIHIILGLGNIYFDKYKKKIADFKNVHVTIYKNVKAMSKHIKDNDIIFTSAGRTVYEIASIGTPTIVLVQNNRELHHPFASSKNGFINLGLGTSIPDEKIIEAFLTLYENRDLRRHNSKLMLKNDLRNGAHRVLKIIFDRYEEEKNEF